MSGTVGEILSNLTRDMQTIIRDMEKRVGTEPISERDIAKLDSVYNNVIDLIAAML